MFIGLAMTVMVMITFLWATVYIRVMAAFGVDSATAIEWINEPAVLQLVNQILSSLLFTLPFFIVLAGCGHKFHEIASFSKPDGKFMAPVVMISIGFCGFANAAGTVILNILAMFGISIADPMIEEPEGVFGKVIVFAGAAIVAPLVEEFAMRGVVMGSLRRYGDGFAIGVSAILFGLMHGNLVQIPFASIVGLALGYAVVKTGSLWTGVLIHAINNAIASVLSWLVPGDAAVAVQNASYCFYLAACMLCAFIGLLMLKGKSREMLELSDGDTELSGKQKITAFFTGPLMIVYIILVIVEVVLIS